MSKKRKFDAEGRKKITKSENLNSCVIQGERWLRPLLYEVVSVMKVTLPHKTQS